MGIFSYDCLDHTFEQTNLDSIKSFDKLYLILYNHI